MLTRSARRLGWFSLGMIVVLFSATCTPTSTPIPPPDRLAVSGFIVVAPPRANDLPSGVRPEIYVPGVDVELRDVPAGTVLESVRTDLSGRFRFSPQVPGGYQACWSAPGLVSNCNKFELADRHLYLGEVRAAVDSAKTGTTFHGRVTLAGGARARRLEPLLGVNAFATVRATDGQGNDGGRAYVNNFGEYLLPTLVQSPSYELVASIEAASEATNAASAGLSSRVDFELDQHPPEIRALVGAAPGGTSWTAAPGDLVEVHAIATDADGDALQYRWLLPDGSVVPAAASDSTSFQLPPRPGSYTFVALASDGRGGYSREDVTISTAGVRFGGVVAATDAPAVADAEVEVNGTTITTAADGRFNLFVPESERYVLNIRKSGYGLVSKIYDNGVSGGRYLLTRASVHVVTDPNDQEIDVTNDRRPGDCPGSLSDRLRDRYPTGQQPDDRPCGPGIRVRIPAGALVDADGNPPAGSVQVELTTVDLRAPDGMPGDYTARTAGGQTRVMESFGAGTVEIVDAGGNEYDLAPGQTAEITIPIPAEQLAFPAAIPATIPLLAYDETTGDWVEEGTLDRVGNAYVGKVEHFSAHNADTLKVNQACIRLETVLMPAQFKLEATVPQEAGPDRVITPTIINDLQRFHALYNLPTNETITLRVFDTDDVLIELLDVNNLGVPIDEIAVNSGGPQNPTDPNRPDFPYDACQTSVELTPFQPVGQAVDEFLHGLYSFAAANLTELDDTDPALSQQFLDATDAYYLAIDFHGRRETLDEFRDHNGFPAGEVELQYANSGDLGFGRDMHCRQVSNFGATGEYACYVTNYGSRFTDDGQDYLDALSNTVPIATVGMEYSRVEDPNDENVLVGDPIVKFYVYKEAIGNARAGSANLDGVGERPVPQLCMVCHGGHYPDAVDVSAEGVPAWTDGESADLGSRFIPFDLASLFMLNPNGAQNQNALRQLNCDIVRNAAPSQELLDVIESMYGAACAGNQQLGNPVSGWDDPNPSTPNLPNKEEVYAQIVTPSCRACHVSQAPSTITWAEAADFEASGGLASLVCNQHVMPHALVTHNRFWLSTGPHQPLLLHNYLNGNDPPLEPGSEAIECVDALVNP